MKKLKVIIHNDDIGLSYGFTDAIYKSYQNGVTTSTSIRTNGTAFKYAAKMIKLKMPNIGIGIHLNLTDGQSHTKTLSKLDGSYKYTYFGYTLRLILGNKKILADIEKEFKRQFELVNENGLKIDHINSQEHIHMIPQIFELTCKLAREYKIKYIRLTAEPFHILPSLSDNTKIMFSLNLIKYILLNLFAFIDKKILLRYRLKTTNAFYGVLQTNNMTGNTLISCIEDAQKRNFCSIEILGHPAFWDKRDSKFTSKYIEKYVKSNKRKLEYESFTSPDTKAKIDNLNISLINYKHAI